MNNRYFRIAMVIAMLVVLVPVVQTAAGGQMVPICHRPQGNPENTQYIEAGNKNAHTGKGHEFDTIGATCDAPPTIAPTQPPATFAPTQFPTTEPPTPIPSNTYVATEPTATDVPQVTEVPPTEQPATEVPVGDPPVVIEVALSCNSPMGVVTVTVANPTAASGQTVSMLILRSDEGAMVNISGTVTMALSAESASYTFRFPIGTWASADFVAEGYISGSSQGSVYSAPQPCG